MKSTFLKVMSVIVLIFGVLGVIVGVMGIGALSLFGFPVAGTVISIIQSILMIVAGVIGIGASGNPAKARSAMMWGIILVILAIVAIIIGIAEMGAVQSTLNTLTAAAGVQSINVGGVTWTNFTGLILPILYFLAAFLFKKKASGR